MNLQLNKNGWFSPDNDTTLQKDLKKKYMTFSTKLSGIILLFFGIYILLYYKQQITANGWINSTIVAIIFELFIIIYFINFSKKLLCLKNYMFYVKTGKLENFRRVVKHTGSGKNRKTHIYYYIMIRFGNHVAEYRCYNNPDFSPMDITNQKEITIATLDNLSSANKVPKVYVLDNVYPEYRSL